MGSPAYNSTTNRPVYRPGVGPLYNNGGTCCFVQELKCEDNSANGAYWAKMSSFDTTKGYKDGSTCIYYGTEKRACLPDGATERTTAVSAPYDDCSACGDICGDNSICPGGLPSTLTTTGTFEVSSDGGATVDATCTFSVTNVDGAYPSCDWQSDTVDCVGVGGSTAAKVEAISGGVDGLGGGLWNVTINNNAFTFSKCGTTPVGSYAGNSGWVGDGGTKSIRYSNIVVS